MCGSPGYVAPEVLHKHKADAKSDIFSLGVVFYNMLTGRALFPGKDQRDILKCNKEVDLSQA